jgi:hypothetical protein
VWNLDDWLLGPLPFVQGWLNNASDKWDAVVQLGIDQWHFWLPNIPLPPFPPFPLATQQATTLAANLTTAQQQPGETLADPLQSLSRRLGLPNAKNTTGAVAGTAHGETPRKSGDAIVAPLGELHATVTKLTDAATTAASGNATDAADAGGNAPAPVAGGLHDNISKRSAAQHSPGGEVPKAHKSARDSAQKDSSKRP